jgi:aspartate aminotransferase-like enzyme
VALSPKAWGFVKESKLPKYYFNFAKALKSAEKNQTPYTSPVSLILGLKEVLGKIKQVGLDKIYAHNERLSKACKAAMKAMGLELYSKDNPSVVLTAALTPAGIDGQKVVAELRKKGIWIAGGQAEAKGKIFRIAHMGFIDTVDLLGTIGGLEEVLNTLGYKVQPGVGLKAAQEVLAKEAAV